MANITVTLDDARAKAREIHFNRAQASDGKVPGIHTADGAVADLLYSSLVSGPSSSRAGRAVLADSRDLWDPRSDADLATRLNKVYDGKTNPEDPADQLLADAGLITVEDQYTAERVGNMKTEVLTRFVEGLIQPQTVIVNNFFRTIRADAGETIGQLREFVSFIEVFSDWEYYEIDPNRGDIRSIDVNFAQYSERVNPRMAMYGVKVEYENFLHRTLPNMHISEILAMLTVGWAKASAMQREYDASKFLTNYLSPEVAFDNANGGASALGQLTGIGMTGVENGTFNLDYDFPRLQDYMEHELGMSTNNLIMLLPRNAWAFMNTRKGYRRFLGLDGAPLYQRPQFTQGPAGSLADDDRYGIRTPGVGFNSPSQAANYLTGTRAGNAARVGEQMVPGPNAWLPPSIPNWMNEFVLPNSAFGPMRVVLTPFAQAKHRYYASGHPLRNDGRSNQPRPVMTTDLLLFDGNYPMFLIETIPPTSWTASNAEFRKSTVVMVEAYALANSARGQQACIIKNAVLDHNWQHDITLEATSLKITDNPLHGTTDNGLVTE